MNRTKISDFLSGKNVWQYYKKYNVTQWYSKEEMQILQLEKLQKLLSHCYENIPYYHNLIIKRNIDISSINTLDILKQFPILTKELIQENHNDFIPRNNPKIHGVKISKTGGTTGNILFKRNDANTRSSAWGSYKRYQDWMGFSDGDKCLRLMGGHVKKMSLFSSIKNYIIRIIDNTISVDIYDTSDETMGKIVLLLEKYSFSLIRAYPQFLYYVAQYLDKNNLKFNINSISSTAELVMLEHRILFKKVFNADTFDQYGCGEIGGIAYECDHHNGLHVAEERVIVETNEKDELITTDLDNYTMPFIRYWNADQVLLDKSPCSCGRKSMLINKVLGRTADCITGINGEFLFWGYFWHLIMDSEIPKRRNLKKIQVVQDSVNSLVFRLVCKPLSDEEKAFIILDIQKRVGDMRITFNYVDDIENTKTGKYRPVINLVK